MNDAEQSFTYSLGDLTGNSFQVLDESVLRTLAFRVIKAKVGANFNPSINAEIDQIADGNPKLRTLVVHELMHRVYYQTIKQAWCFG